MADTHRPGMFIIFNFMQKKFNITTRSHFMILKEIILDVWGFVKIHKMMEKPDEQITLLKQPQIEY